MLDSLKKLFSKKKSEESSEADSNPFDTISSKNEQRTHGRYSLKKSEVAFIEIGKSLKFPVLDLSYGGIRIKVESDQIDAVKNIGKETIHGPFHFLNMHVQASFKFIYCDENKLEAGVSFEHKELDTLIQLRDIIEKLKIGHSIQLLSHEILDDKFKSGDWSVFRAEGPTDIAIKRNNSSTIEEVLITLRVSDIYYELSLLQGVWRSGQTLRNEGPGETSAQILPDTELNHETIINVLTILVGVDESNDANQPLLELFAILFSLQSKIAVKSA